MKKKVLILSYSKIDSDPRVLRQISFFEKQKFEIYLSGLEYHGKYPFFPLQKSKSPIFKAYKLGLMLTRQAKLRVKEFLYHSSLKEMVSLDLDFIWANDLETWPLAIALREAHPHSKVVFDAHEQYAKEFNDRLSWTWFHKRFIQKVCKLYIPLADAFTTVCDGIAKDYERDYGVKARLILNTPDYEKDLEPQPVQRKVKLVHHGIANRSRKIEKMIRLMDFLGEGYELNLILMPSDRDYLEELQAMSEGKNIRFLAPVPTQEIPQFISQFDVGLFILEPVNFNYKYALPNKFFEFIQARLAIAIGPSPEMRKIVEEEKIGLVANSFEEKELARLILETTPMQWMEMKNNTHRIARKYSNTQNELVLQDLLKSLDSLELHY
ncbi:MAG: hypothetical protein LPK25_01060 [Cyclobacteriaceae bacterium]|nr:hypothetical protein [Cyclobacteriaceae bacterium]MDX5465407.1 hypothetical protein [Cyclobacteriaceae bacterium]